MIDEKKLIEELNEITYNVQDADDLFESVTECINRQPKVGEWIPCSERLPKCNGVYVITRKYGEGATLCHVTDSAYFDGQDTWHNDNRPNHIRPYLYDVIAWMPLPTPYNAKRGGKNA